MTKHLFLTLSITLSVAPLACDDPAANSDDAEPLAAGSRDADDLQGAEPDQEPPTPVADMQVLAVNVKTDAVPHELVARPDGDLMRKTIEGLDLVDGGIEMEPRSMNNKLLGTSGGLAYFSMWSGSFGCASAKALTDSSVAVCTFIKGYFDGGMLGGWGGCSSGYYRVHTFRCRPA